MITASPTAPPGSVRHLTTYSPDDFRGSAAVLCRNNAPLVTHAFACIRRGVPVCILGRDLGASLIKVLKAFKAETNITEHDWQIDMYDKLGKWYGREERKLKRPAQRAALDDRRDCLYQIIKVSSSTQDAASRVEQLFTSEPKAGVLVLSTGHKAKGQEWQRVFILDQHLVPSRFAATQAELWQERNLLYVMVTRSMGELSYIKSGCWKS